MRVLIAGGTGFIGRALAERLIREGHAVTVLSRDPRKASALSPPGAKILAWGNGVPELPEGLDAVVQLAGAGIARWPWSERNKNLLVRSRVESTQSLQEAVSRLQDRPGSFVSASGMGYYGNTGNREVQSGDPPGTDFLGRLASSWENEAFKARTLGMRVVVLRLGMVLGRNGGALPKMTLPFRWGLGAKLGSGTQYWPWIHLEDAVEMFFRALIDTAYSGPYQTVAGEPITQDEFSKTLAAAVHRPCVFRVPPGILRLGLGDMADLFLHGQRARNDGPGFKPRFDSLEIAFEAC